MNVKNETVKPSGFSLVEVLMATFVFAVIMVGVAGAFGSSIFSYRSNKAVQQDLERAEFSMNLMAKTIRTSSVVSAPDPETIIIFDYSQPTDNCIGYKLTGDVLQFANAAVADKDACSAGSLSSYADMTDHVNNLSFDVVSSEPAVSPDPAVVGKVTISMEVGTGQDVARLQTTVSLRDYSVSGL